MGWQSYTILFETDEEKVRILDAIQSHNDNDIAEELVLVLYLTLLDGKNLMMFGNGGGRCDTFEYFRNLDLKIEPYEAIHDEIHELSLKGAFIDMETRLEEICTYN